MNAVVPISLFFLNFSLYLRDSSHIVDLILRIASRDVLNYELPLIAHSGPYNQLFGPLSARSGRCGTSDI